MSSTSKSVSVGAHQKSGSEHAKSRQPTVPALAHQQPKSAATIEESDDDDQEEDEDGSDDDGSDNDDDDDVEDSDNSDDLDSRQPPISTNSFSHSHSSSRPQFSTYEPPEGMSALPITPSFSTSPFEFDALVAKPDVELWVIRAPADFKASRLSYLDLNPSLSSGSITTKTHQFKVRAVPSSSSSIPSSAHPAHPLPVAADAVSRATGKEHAAGGLVDDLEGSMNGADESGGEEMSGLRMLVPSVKKGKLFLAPKKIARQFILTPSTTIRPTASTSLPTTASSSSKRKHEQPSHLLKFRNRAFGFDTPGPARLQASIHSSVAAAQTTEDIVHGASQSSVVGEAKQKRDKKEKEKKENKDKAEKMEKVKDEVEEVVSPAEAVTCDKKKKEKKEKKSKKAVDVDDMDLKEEHVERVTEKKKRKHETGESPKKRKKTSE